jgi:hypothetical protein
MLSRSREEQEFRMSECINCPVAMDAGDCLRGSIHELAHLSNGSTWLSLGPGQQKCRTRSQFTLPIDPMNNFITGTSLIFLSLFLVGTIQFFLSPVHWMDRAVLGKISVAMRRTGPYTYALPPVDQIWGSFEGGLVLGSPIWRTSVKYESGAWSDSYLEYIQRVPLRYMQKKKSLYESWNLGAKTQIGESL